MKSILSLLSFLYALNLSAQLPFNVEIKEFASNLNFPVEIANAGDERLFVLERTGIIKIINEDGTVMQNPFLNIQNQVHITAGQSEQGLLGMAFHPEYEKNGFFFIHYTAPNDDGIISRYVVDPNDPNLAQESSEQIIMQIPQPFINHNGGCLRFGPDGYLYIGLGDGGSLGDPQNLAQNTQTLLGKMLRIDIDNGTPYSIPADNPFVNDDSVLDEIWAIGLRNPWKFSFDDQTGDLWIADVGQGEWEEINLQAADSPGGENYGWRCREGNNNFNTLGCPPASDFDPAFLEYSHEGLTHCSITGGFVYRGNVQEVNQSNAYFYADYCSGTIWAAYETANGYVQEEVDRQFGSAITTFGQGHDGEIYFANAVNGRIYHLDFGCTLLTSFEVKNESCEGAEDGCITLDVQGGSGNFTISISTISGDPIPVENFCSLTAGNYILTATDLENGCQVTEAFSIFRIPFEFEILEQNATELMAPEGFVFYQWFLNGEAINGAVLNTYTPLENGFYTVEITDGNGCTFTSTNTIEWLNVAVGYVEGVDRFNLSPNPVSDFLNVDLFSTKSLDVELQIQDLHGRILQSKIINLQGESSYLFNLQDYPNAIYQCRIVHGKESVLQRFVKQ